MRLTRPGIMSVLPARFGIQKLWITSRARSVTSTGWPAGSRTSFAPITGSSAPGGK